VASNRRYQLRSAEKHQVRPNYISNQVLQIYDEEKTEGTMRRQKNWSDKFFQKEFKKQSEIIGADNIPDIVFAKNVPNRLEFFSVLLSRLVCFECLRVIVSFFFCIKYAITV